MDTQFRPKGMKILKAMPRGNERYIIKYYLM